MEVGGWLHNNRRCFINSTQSTQETAAPASTTVTQVRALLPKVEVSWVRFFAGVTKGLLGVCGVRFPQVISLPVSNGKTTLFLSITDSFKCFIKHYGVKGIGIEYARDYIPANGERPGSLRSRPSNGKFFLLHDAEGNYAEQESHKFYINVIVPHFRAALKEATRKAILNSDKIRIEERAMALYVANDLEALSAKEISAYAKKWHLKKAEWSKLG